MNELYKALLEARKEISTINLDGKNPMYSSGYATLHNIMTTIQPVLSKHNLLIYHEYVNEDGTLGIRTNLVHCGEKEQHTLSILFPVEKVADSQKMGSVMSYARRYNIACLFNLTFENDKDDDDTGDSKPTVKKVAPTPLQF